jgi:hypothetical protein
MKGAKGESSGERGSRGEGNGYMRRVREGERERGERERERGGKGERGLLQQPVRVAARRGRAVANLHQDTTDAPQKLCHAHSSEARTHRHAACDTRTGTCTGVCQTRKHMAHAQGRSRNSHFTVGPDLRVRRDEA